MLADGGTFLADGEEDFWTENNVRARTENSFQEAENLFQEEKTWLWQMVPSS